jgi:hypothetical protein
MNKENISGGELNPRTPPTPEGLDKLAEYMAEYPDKFRVIPPGERRECGPEITALENLIDSFKLEHSLKELLLITNSKEAIESPARKVAMRALTPIVAMLNTLEDETNISEEGLKRLKQGYMELSRAVGIINGKEVDHNRKG